MRTVVRQGLEQTDSLPAKMRERIFTFRRRTSQARCS
jgi:hypothetical protein